MNRPPLQLVDQELERVEHDISLDLIVTPDEVIETKTEIPRPAGIYWEHLDQIDAIPVLQTL